MIGDLKLKEKYPFHPVADIFPLMSGKQFDDLVMDIERNGQREPIWLYDGQVIDGRNRARACCGLCIEPVTKEWNGSESNLISFVVSLNLHRRHLDESQRAMVAAKIVNMPNHRPDKGANLHSSCQAGEMLHVSERSVKTARKVQGAGAAELKEAVEQGRVSVSAAADIVDLPQVEQTKVVALSDKEILQKAKEIRAVKADKRRKERIEKIAEIAMGNTDLSTDKKYPIIYADPPWRYGNPLNGSSRDIENHYPTMTLEEICSLPVKDLATDDALLFLWVTAPKLVESVRVIESWGFIYRTGTVWVKNKFGMGYYVRNQHEHLLIAKRGNPPAPPANARQSSVIHAPRTGHSVKPLGFYELIESMYPELPKIELFSRSPRKGWDAWGNQAS